MTFLNKFVNSKIDGSGKDKNKRRQRKHCYLNFAVKDRQEVESL